MTRIISTELNEHHWETEAGQKLIAMTPRKRLGQADDLDGIVAPGCWGLFGGHLDPGEQPEQALKICTSGLNMALQISILLKAVMPNLISGLEAFLKVGPLTWSDLSTVLKDHEISEYQHLAKRVEL